MEQHHPGAKELITDLNRALQNKWDMLGGWTGLYESGQAQRIVARVTAEVEDKELVSFLQRHHRGSVPVDNER